MEEINQLEKHIHQLKLHKKQKNNHIEISFESDESQRIVDFIERFIDDAEEDGYKNITEVLSYLKKHASSCFQTNPDFEKTFCIIYQIKQCSKNIKKSYKNIN